MKVAIYARVSTEKQEKQETIQSQLEALRDYAKKENHIIIDEYLDEGYSGELLARPALDKLRDDAKNGLFEAVVVHSTDRLSRNRRNWHLGFLQEELSKNNVRIIFLNRPDSKDTPEDNLMGGMQGLIAAYEKTKILERTRRGKLHKVANNILVGSIPPYGYKYIKLDKTNNIHGHYEINPDEAKVVRLIFDLFVNKRLSIRKIAKELTGRSISPQRGIHWRTSSLHRIIRNETYTGITYFNKYESVESKKRRNNNVYMRATNTSRRLRPKQEWKPITLPTACHIIDKKLFNQAQLLLKHNSEMSPRNLKNKYLLRGLITCDNCGSPFQGCPCKGKLYYRCGNRGRTFPKPRTCLVKTVLADKIESSVWDGFCNVIQNPKLLRDQINNLNNISSKESNNLNIELLEINKHLESLKHEENRILDAYRGGIINQDKLREQLAKLQEKSKSLDGSKANIESKLGCLLDARTVKLSVEDYCSKIKVKLEQIKDNFIDKQYLLSVALNGITLNGNHAKVKGIIPVYQEDSTHPNSGNIVYATPARYVALLPRFQVPVSHATGL